MVTEVETRSANGRGARRAALGVAVVAAIVAAGGLVSALAHPTGKGTVLPPAESPTPAFSGPIMGLGFSVAYDAQTHEVVVFGGLNSADSTWLWDGHWTLANPATSPAGRSGATAAYDPETQTVMLFGGSLAPGKSANDTWAWHGRTWAELDSGVNGPPPGEGAQMAWDGATGEMVLVTDAETSSGAETWTWTGTHWTRQPFGDLTISVFGDVMAYDPDSRTVLLVSLESPSSTSSVALGWNGTRWRVINQNGPEITGMALNPHDNLVLACGVATYSTALAVQDSCWEWHTFQWYELQAAVPPPDSRQLMVEAEVADPDRARILMLGWLTRAIPGQPQPLHIWSWDGIVWRLLA